MTDRLTDLLTQDISARKQALDTQQSFLVQAPAGSGKTELLTQRFLALLAKSCEQPESILAITFTNKAAAEMRHRVVSSLQKALTQPQPEAEPQASNWRLAKAVVQRSEQLGWGLMQNPARLTILTIDALCGSIVRQLPQVSEFGKPPSVIPDAKPLYLEAANAALEYWAVKEQSSDAIRSVLLLVDNDLQRLSELVGRLLAGREQWLPLLLQSPSGTRGLADIVQQATVGLIQDSLTELKKQWLDHGVLKNLLTEVFPLLEHAQIELRALNEKSIIAVADLDPDWLCTMQGLNQWLALKTLLLTDKGEFRKPSGVTKKLGFPAVSKSDSQQRQQQLKQSKQAYQALLACYSSEPILRTGLLQIANLPAEIEGTPYTSVLSAICELLVLASAFLKMSFIAHEKVDFTEIALGANRALSDTDNSDVAIALSERFEHILIDEFQDTSAGQFRLFESLVQDWSPEGHKTLFLVGDPMQSIYRFRQAEVGLFLQVKQSGLAMLPLQYLRLTRNFRSSSSIVEWVNQHFYHIFPKTDNVQEGLVSYSPALAKESLPKAVTSNTSLAEGVHCHWATDDAQSLADCLKTILSLRQDVPEDSIAILVRSRTHLKSLLPALQQQGLDFEAIEARSLMNEQCILDLFALTSILIAPEDQKSWLAVLRSPSVGVTMKDLQTIASVSPLIWQTIENLCREQLSYQISRELEAGGKQRLKRLHSVLQQSYRMINSISLVEIVQWTWWALGGEVLYNSKSTPKQMPMIDSYWETLSRYCDTTAAVEERFDLTQFEINLKSAYATLPATKSNPIQVMTIHRSKGLEFDHVFLPSLDKPGAVDGRELLRWRSYVNSKGRPALLMAFMAESGLPTSGLYHYLSHREKQQGSEELKRVFYVAVTRGKLSVHLFSCLKLEGAGEEVATLKKPSSLSLCYLLWQALSTTERELALKSFQKQQVQGAIVKEDRVSQLLAPTLNRIRLSYNLPADAVRTRQVLSNADSRGQPVNETPVILSPTVERLIGIYCHQVLEFCHSPSDLQKLNQSLQEQDILRWFALKGCDSEQSMKALQRLRVCFNNLSQDERAQWIFGDHFEARNEWALQYIEPDESTTRTLRIDRSFVEVVSDASSGLVPDSKIDKKRIRWIIDYKISALAESSAEAILEEYSEQLTTYARLLSNRHHDQVKGGLYFPENKRWVEFLPLES